MKKVKFLYKNSFKDKGQSWLRMFPNKVNQFNDCEFIFDVNEKYYDWLVVYNNLPNDKGTLISCPKENTIFITSEPSSITYYGKKFINQFGYILTGQEQYALSHPNKIYQQPALRWFYEADLSKPTNLKELMDNIPLKKYNLISTICSDKSSNFTLHKKRLSFVKYAKSVIPELNHFGKGFNPIKDKSEGLKSYKYHIAIENHLANHWWTEKLSDAFLGCTLPFYYGAPNIDEYFPNKSIIKIDINNPKSSIEIIKNAIKNNEYEKRLSYIITARKKLINEYSIFSVLSNHINRHEKQIDSWNKSYLYSRSELRKIPSVGLENLSKKIQLKFINLIK